MAKNKDKQDFVTDHQNGSDRVDLQDDEHRGMGGSYVIDPETGKRERVAGPGLQPAGQVEESNKEI